MRRLTLEFPRRSKGAPPCFAFVVGHIATAVRVDEFFSEYLCYAHIIPRPLSYKQVYYHHTTTYGMLPTLHTTKSSYAPVAHARSSELQYLSYRAQLLI